MGVEKAFLVCVMADSTDDPKLTQLPNRADGDVGQILKIQVLRPTMSVGQGVDFMGGAIAHAGPSNLTGKANSRS